MRQQSRKNKVIYCTFTFKTGTYLSSDLKHIGCIASCKFSFRNIIAQSSKFLFLYCRTWLEIPHRKDETRSGLMQSHFYLSFFSFISVSIRNLLTWIIKEPRGSTKPNCRVFLASTGARTGASSYSELHALLHGTTQAPDNSKFNNNSRS